MSGGIDGSWAATARAEGPFLLLLGAALCAPPLVQHQGGGWQQAVLAFMAVLAAPAAAMEPMLILARLLIRIEGGAR